MNKKYCSYTNTNWKCLGRDVVDDFDNTLREVVSHIKVETSDKGTQMHDTYANKQRTFASQNSTMTYAIVLLIVTAR